MLLHQTFHLFSCPFSVCLCVGQRRRCSCVCFWVSVSRAGLLISCWDFLLGVSQVNRTMTIGDFLYLLLFSVSLLQSNGYIYVFVFANMFHRSSLPLQISNCKYLSFLCYVFMEDEVQNHKGGDYRYLYLNQQHSSDRNRKIRCIS